MSFWKQILQSRGCYQFAGQTLQRPMLVGYSYRWKRMWEIQSDPPSEERLNIHFPLIQKFWLRMILDPGRRTQKEEVILGHPELDYLYVIHSNQTEIAREFLTSQSALIDLQRFPYPLDRLEIHKGWGKAEFHFPARRKFDRVQLAIAVEALARFFSDYETRGKLLIVISPSQDARCPYCREPFADGSSKIVQCGQCHARIHDACWNENKQCTTWGCNSTAAS